MAWESITHKCGHTERHQLYGPGRDRSRRAEWMAGNLCSECYQAELQRQRAEEAEQAKEQAQRAGLPDLTGSEKQVEWAERLRAAFVGVEAATQSTIVYQAIQGGHPDDEALSEALLQRFGGDQQAACNACDEAVLPLFWEAVASQTSAAWWIDNRHYLNGALAKLVDPQRVYQLLWALAKGKDPAQVDAERQVRAEAQRRLALEAEAEATLRPEQPLSPLVARIDAPQGRIEVRYPERSDTLREVVKRLGYSWQSDCWARSVPKWEQDHQSDRIVEVAHKLLLTGFPVRVWDPELRRRVLAAEYRPDTGRKILRQKDARGRHCFGLYFEYDPQLNAAADRLPACRWNAEKRCRLVPAEAHEEVLDFAQRHGFLVAPGARALAHDRRGGGPAAPGLGG
jgi:hypothetical protein